MRNGKSLSESHTEIIKIYDENTQANEESVMLQIVIDIRTNLNNATLDDCHLSAKAKE